VSARIAGIFFCSTLLIIGSVVLLRQMSLDYDTVVYASQFSILGAVIAGIFGFLIGRILETQSRPSRKKNKHLGINNSLESNRVERENVPD